MIKYQTFQNSDNLHGEIFHMQVLEDISEIIMG